MGDMDLLVKVFEAFANSSENKHVYLSDMKTGKTRWSKSCVEQFGLPGQMFDDDAKIWLEHIHPDDRAEFLKQMDDISAGKTDTHDMLYRVRNKDGEYVLCTCKGSVIRDDDGNALYFAGTLENHAIASQYDPLTNLPSRQKFLDTLKEIKSHNIPYDVMFLGICDFEVINNVYGYEFGNSVLKDFAQKLQSLDLKAGLFHVGGVKSDMTQFMRLYQNSGKAAASLEEELSAFHDRLSAFDKTILEYQNMADGNQPLPDGLSQEDVTILLDAAKEARSQYAKDGADAWNRHAAEAISGDMMLQMRMVTTMADSGKFGAEPWKLDSSSENFSKDMNAVLNLTGSLRHGFQENIDRIFQNWESNGYGVEKIQLHISQMAEQSDISQKETIVNAGNDSLAYLQRAIEDRIFAASTQLV